MRNLKIKFFVCGESIGAENPKLVKKINKLMEKFNVVEGDRVDQDEGKKLISGLLHSISGMPGHYVFNPSYWILKTFYLTYGKYNDYITWLGCEYDSIWTVKDILFNIENEKPNVLCFGLYMWNTAIYLNLIKHVREKYPHIIIIGGGPSVREKWVLKALDFAIYGEGEEGFTHLLDVLIENDELNFTEITNLIYKKDNQLITNTYKIFKYKDYPELPSPYLSNKLEIKETINNYKRTSKSVIPPGIGWELTRGCPYKCSFCDWSSGLHNKITMRKHDWKKELDFILELGCDIVSNDANFGMIKEDLKVIDYVLDKSRSLVISPFTTFPMNQLSWSKFNKSTVYKTIDKILNEHPTFGVKVSIQDINYEVLEAIDRPDVPWEEHKQYLLDIKSKYPLTMFTVELMIGLPKQTLESWIEMLCEFDESFRPSWLLCAFWQLLTNSPAYEKEYQEKYNLISTKLRDLKHSIELKLDNHNTIDLYKSKSQIWSTYNCFHEDTPNGFRDNLLKSATGEIYNNWFSHSKYNKIPYRKLYSKIGKNLIRFVDSQYELMLLNKEDGWIYLNVLYDGTVWNFKNFFQHPETLNKFMENKI
tara:strand:+ start:237 stop:2009 length:1773 start_codon:yes stop_codon:yes gene_type:complete